jgi:hypothetical protein
MRKWLDLAAADGKFWHDRCREAEARAEASEAERDAVNSTWDEIHAEFLYAKDRAEAAEARIAAARAIKPVHMGKGRWMVDVDALRAALRAGG